MTNVLVDDRFRVAGLQACDIADTEKLAAFVQARMDAGADAVVVVGDDATLAAVATTRHEALRHRAEALTFVLLSAGELTTVAASVGASPVSNRNLARAEKLVGSSDRRVSRVPTVRIVDTGRPRPALGFGLGMGAIAELVSEGGRLRRRDALRQMASKSLDLDLSIDWARQAGDIGYLLVSALETTWGGVAMGKGLTLRTGSSPAALLRATSRVGHFVEQRAGAGYITGSVIHIDGNSDYVVDGLVHTSDHPRTLALTEGPQIRVLTV